MTDERLGIAAGAWLRDIDRPPRDSHASVRRAMEQVRTTRQVRRWWPLPVFDRPVSTFPSRELAPAPIPATNGRQPARGFTMFSAVKFVVAGVIVALFGGFLLAGVLTTQPSDDMAPAAVTASPSSMTSEELLSGMVTEEVEPGVYRVVNDGYRDLTSVEAVDIVAGYDDGIWLLREDQLLRLGSDGSHGWPTGAAPEDHILDVAPDGTMWVIPLWTNFRDLDPRRAPGLRSTDGEEWTVEPCPEGNIGCFGFTVAPDGTVWASWSEEDGPWRLGHLGPAGWQPLDGKLTGGPYRRLFFTDAGDLYGMKDGWEPLLRYEDGAWERISDFPVRGVGRDGTVWSDALDRFADGEWTSWTEADFLPDIGFGLGLDGQYRVAPDGGLWSGLWWTVDAESPQDAVCDGLVRFDGDALDRFLPGRCISMDIAPNGSVWVLATDEAVWVTDNGGFEWRWALPDDQTWDLYVITPEAVTATE